MHLFVKYFKIWVVVVTLLVFLGLFATRVLHKEYGVKVVVLEARDRVGGRTFTETVRWKNVLDVFHHLYPSIHSMLIHQLCNSLPIPPISSLSKTSYCCKFCQRASSCVSGFALTLCSLHHQLQLTIFIWFNVTVFIKFFLIQMRYLFEGSIYRRVAFILNPLYFLQTVIL